MRPLPSIRLNRATYPLAPQSAVLVSTGDSHGTDWRFARSNSGKHLLVQEQVHDPASHRVVDVDRLVPVDALASALLGLLTGALAVILGGGGGGARLIFTGGLIFGGLGLLHWYRRLHADGRD